MGHFLRLGLVAVLAASTLDLAAGQLLPLQWFDENKGSLQLSASTDTALPPNTMTQQLPFSTTHTWKLTPTDLNTSSECMQPNAWLLLELYKVSWSAAGQPSLDSTPLDELVFMASKTQPPQITGVSSSGQNLVFSPAENIGGAFPTGLDPGNNGTFTDEAGSSYMRPYHRLLIPNVTATDAAGNMANWFVRIANLDATTNVMGYMIRASCAVTAAVPCPRADLTVGPCNTVNNTVGGSCVRLVPNDPRTFYCDCTAPWASYGCTLNAAVLNMGQTGNVNLASMKWAYWTVQVPQNVARQVLVVELQRDRSSTGGAVPALVVKPTNTTDHNLPTFDDMNSYGDVFSYMYLQSYQYLVIRDFSQGAKFYIGVMNAQQGNPNSVLVGSVKVSWGTPTKPFLCPADCNGRGTCQDPLVFGPKTKMGFVCSCNDGWGGLTCEGSVSSVVASTSTATISNTVDPGQWKYVIMTLDDSFNPKNDDVYLNWQVSDSNGASSTELRNAVFSISEAVYLRELVMTDPPLPYRELDLQYSSMAQQNRFVTPLQGQDLTANQRYIIGLYNCDFSRRSSYSFNLDVYIPSSLSTWLHPYLSVVLGVTAAIVLCLAMTMCKRLVIRRAVANGEAGLLEGAGVGPALMQIMPRQRGVPQAVVDKFPTYTYTAPEDTLVHKSVRPQISRTDREALQIAAAEAATAAAAAVRAKKEEERGSHSKGGSGGGDVELSEVRHGDVEGEGHGVAGEGSVASSSTTVSVVKVSPALDAHKDGHTMMPSVTSHPEMVTVLPPTVSEAEAMTAAAHQAAVAAHQSATSGAAETALPAMTDDEEVPACTVCLCEYEEGDGMRKLPCGHEFHRACIDKWMTQHTTCPICREPLVSQEQLQEAQNAAGSGMAVILIPGAGNQGAGVPAGPRTWRQRLLVWGRPAAASPRGGGGQQLRGAVPWAGNNGNGNGMMVAMAWGNTTADHGDPFASPLPMHNVGSGRPRRSRGHGARRNQGSPRAGPAGVVSEAVVSEPGTVVPEASPVEHAGALPGAVEVVTHNPSSLALAHQSTDSSEPVARH